MSDLFGFPDPPDKGRRARKLGREGMSRALANEREQWRIDYEKYALRWIANRDAPFIGEDIRRAWLIAGYPPPHVYQVWSAMWNAFKRARYVIPIDEMSPPIALKSHGRKCQRYVRPRG